MLGLLIKHDPYLLMSYKFIKLWSFKRYSALQIVQTNYILPKCVEAEQRKYKPSKHTITRVCEPNHVTTNDMNIKARIKNWI